MIGRHLCRRGPSVSIVLKLLREKILNSFWQVMFDEQWRIWNFVKGRTPLENSIVSLLICAQTMWIVNTNVLLFLPPDAVQARYMLWPCVCVVCLSVRISQARVVSKRLHVLSRKLRRVTGYGSSFYTPKISAKLHVLSHLFSFILLLMCIVIIVHFCVHSNSIAAASATLLSLAVLLSILLYAYCLFVQFFSEQINKY